MITDFTGFDHFSKVGARFVVGPDTTQSVDPTPVIAKSAARVLPGGVIEIPGDLPQSINVWLQENGGGAEFLLTLYDTSEEEMAQISITSEGYRVSIYSLNVTGSHTFENVWGFWQIVFSLTGGSEGATICDLYDSILSYPASSTPVSPDEAIVSVFGIEHFPNPVHVIDSTSLFVENHQARKSSWSENMFYRLIVEDYKLYYVRVTSSGSPVYLEQRRSDNYEVTTVTTLNPEVNYFVPGGDRWWSVQSLDAFSLSFCGVLIEGGSSTLNVQLLRDGEEIATNVSTFIATPFRQELQLVDMYADSLIISTTPVNSDGVISVLLPSADVEVDWSTEETGAHAAVLSDLAASYGVSAPNIATNADNQRELFSVNRTTVSGTIRALGLRALMFTDTSDVRTIRFVIKVGDTEYLTDPQTIIINSVDGEINPTYQCILFETNPISGSPWTNDDLRTLRIGIESVDLDGETIRLYQYVVEVLGSLVSNTDGGSFWAM